MKRGLINKMENKKFTVVRVDSEEFELDNGDIYPQMFDVDEDITVEEFQQIVDDSKDAVIGLIKQHNKMITGSDNE